MPIPLGILAVAGAGAAGGGSYELIESTILTGSQSDVTFTSFGTGYKHLQLRIVHRGANASTNLSYFLQLNSDTGSNYAYHRLIGSGSAVSSSAATSQTSMDMPPGAAASAGANQFGASVVDILDYSSTSKNTTVRSIGGIAGDYTSIRLNSGVWLNTAAVTSITIGSYGLNFATGSRFSLYGIR